MKLATSNGQLRDNLILATDAYKMFHWGLYPEGTSRVYSYLESRGGKFPATIFYGLQIYLKKYLEGRVIEQWMIDEADEFCKGMFGKDYFNREGWQRIVDVHQGKIPIKIRAVPEGTLVPNRNVMVVMENTDDQLPWVTNFFETLLFEAEWYGSTVATNSFYIRKSVDEFAKVTGERAGSFHLNDFGFRGVSSKESAGIGGSAHLAVFLGTDTLEGIRYAMHYYNEPEVCGYSVAASEHSVTCMYTRDGELDAYRAFIKKVPSGILSVVSDTYDFYKTVDEYFGKILKADILARDGKFVVRPDSGNPPAVAVWTLKSLWENFGGTTNELGFKVLNPKVGVIYGDGIDYEMINQILTGVVNAGFAVSNIIFGMGGALLQRVDRDTQKMAFKASWGVVDGKGRDVYKSTFSDPSKSSKRGRLKLVFDDELQILRTVAESDPRTDFLETVFENGKIVKEYSFSDIRQKINSYF